MSVERAPVLVWAVHVAGDTSTKARGQVTALEPGDERDDFSLSCEYKLELINSGRSVGQGTKLAKLPLGSLAGWPVQGRQILFFVLVPPCPFPRGTEAEELPCFSTGSTEVMSPASVRAKK